MRQIVFQMVLITLITLGWTLPSFAQWVEVPVTNNSFELPSERGAIPGWPTSVGAFRGVGDVSLTQQRSFDGGVSLRIEDLHPNSSVGLRSGPIPVEPGVQYGASGLVHIESGTNARLTMEFWNAQGRMIGSASASSSNVGDAVGEWVHVIDGWTHVMVHETAPPGAATVTVFLNSTNANVGVSYWDHVKLFRYIEEEVSDALNPTLGWAPAFQEKPEHPSRIPLSIDWDDNDELTNAPVTFGVPFPNHYLESLDDLRLVTDDGQSVPAQFEVTGTWDRADGAVRWVLVHAQVSADQDYYLEVEKGAGSRSRLGDRSSFGFASGSGVQVAEDADKITINTGPMRAIISKKVPTLLHEVALDQNGDGTFSRSDLLITPDQAMDHLPVVIDGEGNHYVAQGVDKIEIVRSGPMEVVVRREGWYVGKTGTRFAQFITYTHFFYGEMGVRHDHTLVTAFDSHKHTIRDIRLSLPLEVDAKAQGVFATNPSSGGNLFSLPGSKGSLVQTDHNRWNILAGDGAVLTSGERAGGWFGLGDARWGAFAGWQDFWQQYPAELEADGHVMHMHLWPSRGVDVLDFAPSARMGSAYPGNHIFWQSFYEGGLDSWTQAYGVGKTHNIWIGFYTEPRRGHAAALTRSFVNKPVLAMASPEWNTSTGVLGRVHHEDKDNFPELEAVLDAIVHRKLWLQERLENYGWIDYGDVNYRLSNPLDPNRVSMVLWRQWASMFYGWPNVSPLLYLRSGRRDAWDLHRTNTRHITDIDIAHLDSNQFQKRKGGRFGGNGGIVHFAANIYNLGPDAHWRFMLYDYYINGNLRVWEVANYYLEYYLARTADASNRRYQHRNTGGSLRLFSEAYEATWKPEYLKAMRQFADILYAARAILGSTRYDDVYMNEGKIKYYQLTGDERMLELFLNDMRTLIERRDLDVHTDIRGTTLGGLAHAYWFTGDESFLDFLTYQLHIALGPDESGSKHMIPTSGDPGLIGATGQTLEHAYHATLGNQIPFIVQLLADLDTPLEYLMSQPRLPALPKGEGAQTLMIHAPDGFSPPPFQDPVRVYFYVPEGAAVPGIHVSAPVHLFDPSGHRINGEEGLNGWIELTDRQAGIWSLEPVSTLDKYEIRAHNIPSLFALGDANRFGEAEVFWVEWPFAPGSSQGSIPLNFRLQGKGVEQVERVQVYLDEELLYEGEQPPQDLSIAVAQLEQGDHRIQVRATTVNKEEHFFNYLLPVEHIQLTGAELSWGRRVRGSIPIQYELMVRPEEVADFSVRLNRITASEVSETITLYESPSVPAEFTLASTEFDDGAYDLEILLTTSKQASTLHSYRLIFDNWEILDDVILPPLQGGWFGTQDRLRAVDRSSGWEYASNNPEDYFNDAQRIRPKEQGGEYLTWKLANVRAYEFTIYARQTAIDDLVAVSFSQDQQSWESGTFTVTSEGLSDGGWYKLKVSGEIPPATTAEYVRLTISGSDVKEHKIELGRAHLKALKQ